MRTPPQRVLVKEVNWLGDVVMSLPAVHAVRRAYPEAHLSILIRSELASFFDGTAWVDEVIPYRIGNGLGGVRDRLALIANLRSKRFDLAISLPRSFEAALWPALARIPRRAGVAADGRAWLLTDSARVDTKNPHRHQVHSYLEMLERTLGVHGEASDVRLDAGQQHRTKMREWLTTQRRQSGRLVAVAPAAAYGPAKEWPAQHFATLIDQLAARQIESVLVGGPGERDKCVAIAAASRSGAIVAAGQTSIAELIALLSLSDAFVGNDSGAMHVAGALGIPTIGIFGSTNPVRTGPLGPRTRVIYEPPTCSPCLERTCRFGHYDCLRQITPAAVLAAVVEGLGG